MAGAALILTHLLRDEIAPALRAQGLRGSGSSYAIPSDSHWALLGIQRSTWNTSELAGFTFNLKVVRRDTWDAARVERPYLPAKPNPNHRYGKFEWNKRIVELMPPPPDRSFDPLNPDLRVYGWFWVDADSGVAAVTQEAIGAVRNYGLPAMRDQMSATTACP